MYLVHNILSPVDGNFDTKNVCARRIGIFSTLVSFREGLPYHRWRAYEIHSASPTVKRAYVSYMTLEEFR